MTLLDVCVFCSVRVTAVVGLGRARGPPFASLPSSLLFVCAFVFIYVQFTNTLCKGARLVIDAKKKEALNALSPRPFAFVSHE